MPVKSEPPVPHPAVAHDRIRAELEQIVASPAFRNSKRFTVLFRHLIERTLEGRQAELKERLIGVEVFGRPADYDTNSDPIVRTSAGELRKRIAQFYHGPGQNSEIRIDVPIGSYAPEIVTTRRVEQVDAPPPSPLIAEPEKRSGSRTIAIAALSVTVVAALVFGWRAMNEPSATERFWRPVLDSHSSVALCVASVGLASGDSTAGVPAPQPSGFAFADVAVTTKLAGAG